MDLASDVLILHCDDLTANGKKIFKPDFVLTINHRDYLHEYPFPVCELFRISVMEGLVSGDAAYTFKYQVFPHINPEFLIDFLESFLQRHKEDNVAWSITTDEAKVISKNDFEIFKVTFEIFQDGSKWGIQMINPPGLKKMVCSCINNFLKQYKINYGK